MNILSVMLLKLAILAVDPPTSSSCSVPAGLSIPDPCTSNGSCTKFSNQKSTLSQEFVAWVVDGTIYAASMDTSGNSGEPMAVACPNGTIGSLTGAVDDYGDALLVWEYHGTSSSFGTIQSSYYDIDKKKWTGLINVSVPDKYDASLDASRVVSYSKKYGWQFMWNVKWVDGTVQRKGHQSGVFNPPSDDRHSKVPPSGSWDLEDPTISLGNN